MYTDDTLYYSFICNENVDVIERFLNEDLLSISKWLNENLMKIWWKLM